jgi:hypothetical protein
MDAVVGTEEQRVTDLRQLRRAGAALPAMDVLDQDGARPRAVGPPQLPTMYAPSSAVKNTVPPTSTKLPGWLDGVVRSPHFDRRSPAPRARSPDVPVPVPSTGATEAAPTTATVTVTTAATVVARLAPARRAPRRSTFARETLNRTASSLARLRRRLMS